MPTAAIAPFLNNGTFRANRSLTIPVEEAFFDLVESRFADLFHPPGRITQEYADGQPTWHYRPYPETGTFVGYREPDRAAAYYDHANAIFLIDGTVESRVKDLGGRRADTTPRKSSVRLDLPEGLQRGDGW